ncbi:MAG: hypothetical protein J5922_03130 [Clostridia bacterium]|nr:hypothetical protein [Clostridia bacterium]
MPNRKHDRRSASKDPLFIGLDLISEMPKGENVFEPYSESTLEKTFFTAVRVYAPSQKTAYGQRFINDSVSERKKGAVPCARVDFFAAVPRFADMSESQKTFYRYFVKCAEEKNFIECDCAYVFLLVYEIINIPGLYTPKQGAALLCDLYIHYRKSYTYLDAYLPEWICDFCMTNGLLPPSSIKEYAGSLFASSSLGEFFLTNDGRDHPFSKELICALSSYKPKIGKFYKDHKAECDKCLFSAASDFLGELWQNDKDRFLLAKESSCRTSFEGALCLKDNRARIECEFYSLEKSPQIKIYVGDVIKICENELRKKHGERFLLKTTIAGDFEEEKIRSLMASQGFIGDEKKSDCEKFFDMLTEDDLQSLRLLFYEGKDIDKKSAQRINAASMKLFGALALEVRGDGFLPGGALANTITEAFIEREMRS